MKKGPFHEATGSITLASATVKRQAGKTCLSAKGTEQENSLCSCLKKEKSDQRVFIMYDCSLLGLRFRFSLFQRSKNPWTEKLSDSRLKVSTGVWQKQNCKSSREKYQNNNNIAYNPL